MYDQQGKQRQGCAVFDDVVGGSDSKSLRGHLRTCVHELGHCFNLHRNRSVGWGSIDGYLSTRLGSATA